jgi:protein-L-isoaspartate(D-aspartate) O-methyltransferase
MPPAKREDLVRVLRTAGVDDPRVLESFERVAREAFVPPESRNLAYYDMPVPIAHGQVTTQPSLMATMVQALRLKGHERVFEIGTGLGFETAILACLCREVISIEWFADLCEEARANLEQAGVRNATIVAGDGSLGWPARAPYDGIVVAAASPGVSDALIEQLVEGGRLVQPIGPGGDERVTAFVKHSDRLVEAKVLTGAHFVPLRGACGIVSE